MPDQPRIAIIGDGNVGSALLRGLRRSGHDVQAVGHEPDRVREIASDVDIVFLAVPFAERENAIDAMGEAIKGKVLVDVTNALDASQGFAASFDRSGAEGLQEMVQGAHVVKAFNTVFAQNMAAGQVHGEPLTLFVAADDEDSKRQVLALGGAIGFDPVDAGPLENARWLEALGFFNIRLGYGQRLGPDMGFKLVRKETATRPAKETGRSRVAGRAGRRALARSSKVKTRRPTPVRKAAPRRRT